MLDGLPRLLYLADVPVEASAHGSMLLYRLLQDYPPEKLCIVETNLMRSEPARRLASVRYQQIHMGWRRPLNSRLKRWYTPWLSWAALFKRRALERQIRGFAPGAVLTVHQGYAWLTAARQAGHWKIPLHLILHDDWNRWVPFPEMCRPWLDRQFGKIYRQAASRLCVSPYMEQAYGERYGARGTVLYPSRARNCPEYDQPPSRLRQAISRLSAVYLGNIFSRGMWNAVIHLADSVASLGGRLVLYTPHTREQAADNGLNTANVECRGFVKSDELAGRLRDEADVVLIPMSFAESDRANMEISFPSKLADATIPGIPLVIYGPPYCSAVRWAKENPGVATVVDKADPALLSGALKRIEADADYRLQLGQAALECGRKYFSHAATANLFRRMVSVARQ